MSTDAPREGTAPPRDALTRREFSKVAAGLALAPGLIESHLATPAPHAASTAAWPGYDGAMVIDFLASAGPFNTPVSVDALTPEMLRNVQESGITAINLTIGGRNPEEVFTTIARWERDLERHPGVLMKIRTSSDLQVAKRERKLGLIYGFQDGVAIDRDLSRVALYHAFGLRIVQLTYNVRNLFGDGCLQPENGGLTPLGRELVERLNAQGVIVDLGHCGQRTTAEAIAHSGRPVAISHSACRAIADRPRSKRDAELKAMADKGGVIGLYLMPFLSMQGQPTSDDLLRHIEHAVNVCGEDHVGIGSDLSITPHVVDDAYMRTHRTFVEGRLKAGIAAPGEDPDVPMFVSDLNTPRRMERIAEKLQQRGHGAARIEKILGGNFARLIRDTWLR
ncbi:MAG: membrane dipeptidase [Gemmatimonadaceae bacterium]|nr:membrane dipeptidase [Gemmatimonadaceae bacterium]